MKQTLIVMMAFLGTLAQAKETKTFGCYYTVVKDVLTAGSNPDSEPKYFELKAPVVRSTAEGGGVTEEIFEIPEKSGFGVEVYMDEDGSGKNEYFLAIVKIHSPAPNLATESLASTDLRSSEGYDDYITAIAENDFLAAKCVLKTGE